MLLLRRPSSLTDYASALRRNGAQIRRQIRILYQLSISSLSALYQPSISPLSSSLGFVLTVALIFIGPRTNRRSHLHRASFLADGQLPPAQIIRNTKLSVARNTGELNYSVLRSLSHSLTHLLTHSLTHSLTYSK